MFRASRNRTCVARKGRTTRVWDAGLYRPVMGSDADDEHPAGKNPVGETRSGRYRSGHGDSSRVLHSREGQPAAGAEDARPPGFPSVEELCELNRAIHEDAGQPERYKLDQPAPLESCLDRARAGYAASPEGVVKVAAALAHGIAQSQAFRDGNRRTAYFAAQYFLAANGLGYLRPRDRQRSSPGSQAQSGRGEPGAHANTTERRELRDFAAPAPEEPITPTARRRADITRSA
jgi:death-on-curing protein